MCAESAPGAIRAPSAARPVGRARAGLPGCSARRFTRASDDASIDEPGDSPRASTAGTSTSRWPSGARASRRASSSSGWGAQPSIAILRIANDTSEHIAGALDNLLNAAETQLVQTGRWNVVDNSTLMADAVLAERLRDLGDEVDDATIAALGKEFGIQYFINGRVGDTAEKSDDTRRVQYYLFLRCTEVSTKLIKYQASIDMTKQVED